MKCKYFIILLFFYISISTERNWMLTHNSKHKLNKLNRIEMSKNQKYTYSLA